METLIEFFKANPGSKAGLARHLKVTAQAVSLWKRVPADRALEVSRFSGISVNELRPDVFGPVEGK